MHAKHSKFVEKNSQQKKSLNTSSIPEAQAEYFQVIITVLEGRNLAVSSPMSATTYVTIILDGKKRRTGLRKNTINPTYDESFKFDLTATLVEMRSTALWVAVMEPRLCASARVIGETSLELGTVWDQPNHQIYHKWAQLCNPKDKKNFAVGFLKLDIMMPYQGHLQVLHALRCTEHIEGYNYVKLMSPLRHYNHTGYLSEFWPRSMDEGPGSGGRIGLGLEGELSFGGRKRLTFSLKSRLLHEGMEKQQANYIMTIHGAYGLPNIAKIVSGNKCGKPPSTFARVSFCGHVAQTGIQYRNVNPKYREQISIIETFPTVNQTIVFELFSIDGCISRLLAGTSVQLNRISHDGENGYLPTFGPSLLHMYSNSATYHSTESSEPDDANPFHRGSLLVSIKTIWPYHQKELKKVFVQPVAGIHSCNLWTIQDFCIYCPLFEVTMIDRQLSGSNCGVAITIGEMPAHNSNDTEFVEVMNQTKTKKLHYTRPITIHPITSEYGFLNFPSPLPVLQLATQLPDFRFRMFQNNMVDKIVIHLENVVEKTENQLKNLQNKSLENVNESLNQGIEEAVNIIVGFLETQLKSHNDLPYSTELDNKQMAVQKEEIERTYHKLFEMTKKLPASEEGDSLTIARDAVLKKTVKLYLVELKIIIENLTKFVFRGFEGWPDIVVWFLNNGSRFAFTRISPANIIYSAIPEEMGKNCGKIQDIYLKPMKCSRHLNSPKNNCDCIAGKIEMMIWMGLYQEKKEFESFLPEGFKIKMKDFTLCLKTRPMMVECRAFLYRAKLKDFDCMDNADILLVVNIFNMVKEAKSQQKALINQVLKFQSMILTTPDKLAKSPPVAIIEVFVRDSTEKIFIGRVRVQSIVEDRREYEYSPKLQWHRLESEGKYVGQVLMSLQVLQVAEEIIRSTTYGNDDTSLGLENQSNNVLVETVQAVPSVIIPKFSTYKIDVYWWGLRNVEATRKPCMVLEIEDLVIKSDVIEDNKPNTNFTNGLVSHIMEEPLSETFTSSITIRLLDSATFGRTLYCGKKVVRNPSKYVVTWMPLEVRSFVLNSASKVSVLNLGSHEHNNDELKGSTQNVHKNVWNPINVMNFIKNMYFINLNNESREEEYSLLPMFSKEKYYMNDDLSEFDSNDWWSRFISSQNDCVSCDNDKSGCDEKPENKITIYKSELENQPEFSKFKDWCPTLKLYRGRKTGIPQNDEKLQCGFLKAGIAIYKWPPPENTVVVSDSGANLNKGFFDDYPQNTSTGLLIRIYIVQADLKARDNTFKFDPYVIISCGKKTVGDRENYVSNTNNPVFGNMYEFKCNLPDDYLVNVHVYNRDIAKMDELIGSTSIDVEDRFYSKHKARVGLPQQYNLSGAAKWRDCVKPSVTLEEVCYRNHIPAPTFPKPGVVVVNNVTYIDENHDDGSSPAFLKESICLNILHKWHTIPLCGFKIVPEHVESRTLYNQHQPKVRQGQIQLWLDIYPQDHIHSVPAPIDISPKEPEDYELRVIIRDLKIFNIHEKQINIYVKAWLGSNQNPQYTDVHYGCTNGAGEFNWRMIFNFKYLAAEKELIHIDKGPFIEYKERASPTLVVLAYDNNYTEEEHCLGGLSLNLCAMPQASVTSQSSNEPKELNKTINLFNTHNTRGCFPLKSVNLLNTSKLCVGTIDLELSVMSLARAVVFPAGLGREPPSPLPAPRREISDTNCFTHKASQIFSHGKKTCLLLLCIAVFLLGAILIFFFCFEIV